MAYTNDMKQTQKISKETVEYLRDLRDKKTTTGRIAAKVVEKVREEWANQIAYHENKIVEHDMKIKEQESFLTKLRRALNGVVK